MNRNTVSKLINENIAMVIAMILIGIICWFVPLASGDDWTFSTWYSGLKNAPATWIWLYLFFNGRPTTYSLFTLCHYADLWFVVTPICFFIFFVAAKKLLKITGLLPQSLMACLLFCFSWTMKRNIYLWQVGNYAYWVPWVIELILFAWTYKYSNMMGPIPYSKTKAILLGVAVFTFNFGSENMALGIMFLYLSCAALLYIRIKKTTIFINVALIASTVSAALCIFNPVGERLSASMEKVNIPFTQMVRNNIYSILNFMIHQNFCLYIFAGALLFILIKQLHIKKFLLWKILFGIQYAIFCIIHFPLNNLLEKISYNYITISNLLTNFNHVRMLFLEDSIFFVVFWFLFLAMLFIGFFYIVYRIATADELIVIVSLFVCAAVCAGVFLVLPEIYERVMFFTLSTLILYCGYLCKFVVLDVFPKKIAMLTLGILMLFQFEELYYNTSAAYEVTCARERIIEEYHTLQGLGLADNIYELVLPAYKPDTINWDNSNCNPSDEINLYPYQAMKAYYNLPDDVKVIIK